MKHIILKNIPEVGDYLYSLFEKSIELNSLISIALSGGNTPKELFTYWAKTYTKSNVWHNILYFWVDERAVKPNHPESNYGVANSLFFSKMNINNDNIFRMKAENNITDEAKKYEQLLLNKLESENGIPIFDFILLGIGDDGHTASIFPGNEFLFSIDQICKDTANPYTKQKRITLTGKVLNHASQTIFIVLGDSKKEILKQIMENKGSKKFPAEYITNTELTLLTNFQII